MRILFRRVLLLMALFAPPSVQPLRAQDNGGDKRAEALAAYRRAEALHKQGKLDEAIKELERGVALARESYGPEDPSTAALLARLADYYTGAERYYRAEALYQQSLKIAENKRGADHLDTATVLDHLADLYQRMGLWAKAEPLYVRSLKIREAHPDLDKLVLLDQLGRIAGLYLTTNQLAKAEDICLKRLKVLEVKFGPKHQSVAANQAMLARVYTDTGRLREAESLYQRSLSIFDPRGDSHDGNVAATRVNLAHLYQKQGKLAEAEQSCQRAIAAFEANGGGRADPRTADAFKFLYKLRVGQERWNTAAAAVDRAFPLRLSQIRRILQGMTETEQLRFLNDNFDADFYEYLSLGLQHRDDADVVRRSAGWVLNGKAVTNQILAERELQARDSQDPQAAEVVSELRAIRDKLSRLALDRPEVDASRDVDSQAGRLVQREQELSKRLGQVAGRPLRADPWVSIDEVRQALPVDSVLVEFVGFYVYDFKERQYIPSLRYVAWIIPPAGGGDIQLVDLGRASLIDNAIRLARRSMAEAPANLQKRGEPESEKELLQRYQTLSGMVLRPLLPHIGKAKHWIISPDSSLWLFPWSALPLSNGKYAVEEHRISYVLTGRDLVAKAPTSRWTRPIVMADPDYDLNAAAAPMAAAPQVRGSPRPAPPSGPSRSLRLNRVPRLIGTAREAQLVAPKLKAYAQAEPMVQTDKQALEGVFKAVHHPRVVVLSTHGFFLEDQKEVPHSTQMQLERYTGKPLDNPLLRCGLLLAGCNNSKNIKPGDEDGILTGLEIVGIDLRGTELVVLSACETGLGEVRNGEGVAGLRQAFQLAGARCVVATLWQVPDRDTGRLMSSFFDELAKGKDRAEALRQAQLSLIQARRERYDAAHPFFWAAFTLTGQ